MDVCRLTASVRCVGMCTSSCRAIAANSLVLRLPVSRSSTLKHKAWQALRANYSLSVCVRCQGEAAAPAKNPPVSRPVLNTSVLTPVYVDFLHRMSICSPQDWFYPEQAVLDTVGERVKANGASQLPEACIKASAGFGAVVYSFHPVDLQAKIAHFTALTLVVDDLPGKLTGAARERYLEDMSLFQMRFTDPQEYARRYPGRGDLHEVLENYMLYLKTDQSSFFTSHLRLHSLFVKVVFDYIEANLVEQHFEEHPIEYTAEMSQLPRFLRYKSGLSEVYAYFIIMQTSSSGSASQDERFFYNRLYPMVPELIDAIDSTEPTKVTWNAAALDHTVQILCW